MRKVNCTKTSCTSAVLRFGLWRRTLKRLQSRSEHRSFAVTSSNISATASNEESQLYEDIMYFYRPEVRPVETDSEKVAVTFGASFIRLINLDEKQQLLTINLWLEMQWVDPKLRWNPTDYGNITKLHISTEQIWTPDIVLYNNAAGDPQVTIFNDAMLYFDGTVNWKPPAIYKSFCEIDIKYFPFDEQNCKLKFGGWSNTAQTMDMIQLVDKNRNQKIVEIMEPDEDDNSKLVKAWYNEEGMDLSYFQPHPQWDLLNVTSHRHEKIYADCCGLLYYVDITFKISLRRKPLFYAVNLVIPCMLLALMTPFVFYLPAEGHKMTFAISIMLTLMVFMLVLAELIPPVSLSTPLMGVYLLFTMLLITFSIFMSTLSLSIHHQGSNFRRVPRWMRAIFVLRLPKFLCLRPYEDPEATSDKSHVSNKKKSTLQKYKATEPINLCSLPSSLVPPTKDKFEMPPEIKDPSRFANYKEGSPEFVDARFVHQQLSTLDLSCLTIHEHPSVIKRMLIQVKYIADYFKRRAAEAVVCDEWNYVAMVLDRICLYVFLLLNLLGTFGIIFTAPSIWDTRAALPDGAQIPTKPLGGDTEHAVVNQNWDNMD